MAKWSSDIVYKIIVLLEGKVCNFFSSSNQVAFRRKLGLKLKAIEEELAIIRDDRRNFHLEERIEETRVLVTKGRSWVTMLKRMYQWLQ